MTRSTQRASAATEPARDEAGGALLRPTHWRDLARLAELETDLFGAQAWSQRSWWSELAARPRRAYVTAVAAPPEGDPVAAGESSAGADVLGYAGVDLGSEVADVMTIAVAPGGRRRGLGTTLLAWCVGTAREYGAAHLMLEVAADNTAARHLYERDGFAQVSVRRGYYSGVDAIVMRRALDDRRTA